MVEAKIQILPKTFGITAYPTLILINTDGEIIYDDGKNQGKSEMLVKLLKEHI